MITGGVRICCSILVALTFVLVFATCQRTIDVKFALKTLVGTGSNTFNRDGLPGTQTTISQPIGVFYDDEGGDLYFSDTYNHRVRVLRNSTGLVETLAGNGTQGYSGEGITATNSMLSRPFGLFVSKTKDIYIAGNTANRIHKLSSLDGKLYTFAGIGLPGYNGEGLLANQSRIYQPLDVKIINQHDPNNVQFIISDTYGHRIRTVNGSSMVTKTLIGTGSSVYNGDGLEPLSTNLNMPRSVVLNGNSEIYFTSVGNNLVRKYDLDRNVVKTVSGVSGNNTHTGDGGLATFATFSNINGIAFSSVSGDLFICETGYHAIRKISIKTGIITVIAGNGVPGYNGDDSQDATKSYLKSPRAIVATMSGELIFTDTDNNRIRQLTPVCPSGYIMDTQQTGCIESCFGIVYNSSLVCGSNGVCSSSDKCVCNSGYYGLDCSIPICLAFDQETGKCSSNLKVVRVDNIDTNQLSNKSISISTQNSTVEGFPQTILFPLDFSRYITNQTSSSTISLLTAVSKGGNNVTVSSTVTYSVISDIITISLASTNGNKIMVSNLEQPIKISFNIPTNTIGNLTCMYFDENNNEWKSDGIETSVETLTVNCLTYHLTSFSVIDINIKKATAQPNNPIISNNSTSLSQEAIIAISISIVGSAIVCCVLAIILVVVICLMKRKTKSIN